MWENILLVSYATCIYAALPIAMIWGWVRWFGNHESKSAFPLISLTGLALSTGSAFLAIAAAVYVRLIGGFPYSDPGLMRIYRWGGILAILGILFGIAGMFRKNALRWHAPLCALGMLLFWIMTAVQE